MRPARAGRHVPSIHSEVQCPCRVVSSPSLPWPRSPARRPLGRGRPGDPHAAVCRLRRGPARRCRSSAPDFTPGGSVTLYTNSVDQADAGTARQPTRRAPIGAFQLQLAPPPFSLDHRKHPDLQADRRRTRRSPAAPVVATTFQVVRFGLTQAPAAAAPGQRGDVHGARLPARQAGLHALPLRRHHPAHGDARRRQSAVWGRRRAHVALPTKIRYGAWKALHRPDQAVRGERRARSGSTRSRSPAASAKKAARRRRRRGRGRGSRDQRGAQREERDDERRERHDADLAAHDRQDDGALLGLRQRLRPPARRAARGSRAPARRTRAAAARRSARSRPAAAHRASTARRQACSRREQDARDRACSDRAPCPARSSGQTALGGSTCHQRQPAKRAGGRVERERRPTPRSRRPFAHPWGSGQTSQSDGS